MSFVRRNLMLANDKDKSECEKEKNMDDYFSYYEAYSESHVAQITKNGFTFIDGKELSFEDSQKYYAIHSKRELSSCIGERDITDCSFMLYDSQHPIMIKFLKKGFFSELFGKSIYQRFYEFEKTIIEHGYTTMDMS